MPIKYDDAKVDLSLWAFGGDGIDLERTCNKIRCFLLIQWVKLLTRESLKWLSVQDPKTRDKDQCDIHECVTCTANSKW